MSSGKVIFALPICHHLAHYAHTPVLCLDETPCGDISVAIAIEDSADATSPVPLSTVLADKAWAKVRFGALQSVSLLAEFFPPLEPVYSQRGRDTSLLKADALFSFDWQVALGEHLLSPSQFEALIKNATGVIRFKGEYLYLDPHDIDRLRAHADPGRAV